MKTTTQDKLNSSIEKLIEKVETAGSWTKPFKQAIMNGMPANYKSHEEYKGANVFMLWMEAIEKNYQTNYWLTFKQCTSLKGKVLKGEKGTPIFFFKPLQFKEEMENVKTGENELVTKTIPMLKMYYVFNIEQTDIKLPEVQADKPLPIIEKASNFFNKLNYIEIKGALSPYYSPMLDYIGMPNKDLFINIGEYYSTLGHEYIHSTGHTNRLDRTMSQKQKEYAYEELIAEIGSAYLMAHLGIEDEGVQDNSSAYLKGWLKALKNDKKILWKASSEAFKAFTYLTKYIEEKEEAA